MTNIHPDLIKLLVCPKCKTPVLHKGSELLCANTPACGLRYPIRDGIPIMLISEALPQDNHAAH